MRLRLVLSLTLLLSFGFCTAASFAASDMDVAASTQLRLLEMKYFDHTFDGDSSEDRVARIERLVKGDVSEGSPQDRVKKLAAALTADGETLVPQMESETPVKATGTGAAAGKGKNGTASGSQTQTGPGSGTAPASSQSSEPFERGDYPKITNLEHEILKQTYAGEPLSARLARLETKAFGSPINSTDLGARTDKLEDYAEQTLHDKPFAVNQDIDKPYVLSSAPPRANAPAGAAQALEHFFNMNRSMTEDFNTRGAPATVGWGVPGSGNFLGREGGGGAPPSSSMPGQNQTSQMDDDPEVYQKDPPPANARMLTRVAWCEVQTFGHTFPNMHLTRRLRQLSDEVMPKMSKENDFQLMDDLDPIEKAVIARKGGASKSISTTTNPGNAAGVR